MMGWHVTGQVQRQVMGPSGQFVPSIEVHFQTDDGTTGSVTIPKAAFNVDTAKERIDAYVAHLSDVADLRG